MCAVLKNATNHGGTFENALCHDFVTQGKEKKEKEARKKRKKIKWVKRRQN